MAVGRERRRPRLRLRVGGSPAVTLTAETAVLRSGGLSTRYERSRMPYAVARAGMPVAHGSRGTNEAGYYDVPNNPLRYVDSVGRARRR
ncbi:MAG TPA: hypothetical protein P5568_05150 [Acidobacteriota bacterium]|mgnify:CR=1 FL=1|nr:hypothetical protein [Acidobacteriota bacterium]